MGQQAYEKALAEGETPGEAEKIGETAREEARLTIIRSIAAKEASPETPQA